VSQLPIVNLGRKSAFAIRVKENGSSGRRFNNTLPSITADGGNGGL
jgi:hypothetical protein